MAKHGELNLFIVYTYIQFKYISKPNMLLILFSSSNCESTDSSVRTETITRVPKYLLLAVNR